MKLDAAPRVQQSGKAERTSRSKRFQSPYRKVTSQTAALVPILNAEASAAMRDRLAAEIAARLGGRRRRMGPRSIAAKIRLPRGCRRVATAFRDRMQVLESGPKHRARSVVVHEDEVIARIGATSDLHSKKHDRRLTKAPTTALTSLCELKAEHVDRAPHDCRARRYATRSISASSPNRRVSCAAKPSDPHHLTFKQHVRSTKGSTNSQSPVPDHHGAAHVAAMNARGGAVA